LWSFVGAHGCDIDLPRVLLPTQRAGRLLAARLFLLPLPKRFGVAGMDLQVIHQLEIRWARGDRSAVRPRALDIAFAQLMFDRYEPIQERVARLIDPTILEYGTVEQPAFHVEFTLVIRQVHCGIGRIEPRGNLGLIRNGVDYAVDFDLARLHVRLL